MDWQLIDSAPKDGAKILAYGRQGWDGDYKNYAKITGIQVVYWRKDTGWWQVETVSYYCETMRPTHWMPLPKPPQS